jgi:hypothetical protein
MQCEGQFGIAAIKDPVMPWEPKRPAAETLFMQFDCTRPNKMEPTMIRDGDF